MSKVHYNKKQLLLVLETANSSAGWMAEGPRLTAGNNENNKGNEPSSLMVAAANQGIPAAASCMLPAATGRLINRHQKRT